MGVASDSQINININNNKRKSNDDDNNDSIINRNDTTTIRPPSGLAQIPL